MPLENQVISLDLAKELAEVMKEKCITPPKSYFWHNWKAYHWEHRWEITHRIDQLEPKHYPAYTVAELGEMLPSHAYSIKEKEKWVCRWWGETTEEQILRENRATIGRNEEAETETDARCKMLIYLLKNNLMTL